MGAAAELFVRVTADVKGLTSGMDEAAKAIDNAGKGAAEAVKPVSNLMDIIKGTAAGELLADGIRSAAGAMVELGQKSLNLASELEQNKIAFTTMLGSGQKADAFLRDLAAFAANTPFELRGLTDSSKKLLAFGFDAQAVLPIMNSIGNAVAAVGGGKDVLDGVTMALGQMAAKGKVSAEEMNQLAERGIPAWKMLADGIGVSVPEAMKKAEKGSIDANTAIVALVNGMNAKFPDMMAKQAQTFGGAMSNLTDSVDMSLTRIGTKLIETFQLTKLVQGMSVAIGNLTAAFQGGGLIAALDVAFGPATKAAILGIGAGITASLTPAILASAAALPGIVAGFAAATAAAAPFIAAGLAVAALAYPIIKNWDAIKGTVAAVFDTAAQYASAYYNRAARVFNDIYKVVASVFSGINAVIRDTLGVDIAAKLGVGFAKVGGVFTGFKTMAVEGLGLVAGRVKEVGNTIASDFTHAFRQGAAAATAATGKVTADMLGLGKTAAAATGAAAAGHKKAADTAKAHAAEVKKAEVEARKLASATERAFKLYMQQETATQALGKRLEDVVIKSESLGRTFDLAGAKSKAYADSLSGLEAAFGKYSPQAIKARQEMERFRAESEAGGKANADAYRVIEDGNKALDAARLRAKELGNEWDDTKERLDAARVTLGKLIDQGLKPGNKAYDDAKQSLDAMKLAAENARTPFERLTEALKEVGSNLSGLGSNLKTVLDAFGIEALNPVVEAIGKFGTFSSAVVGLIGAVEGLGKAGGALIAFMGSTAIPTLVSLGQVVAGALVPAFTTLSVALTANPIGLIVAGVAALIVAGLALYENWDFVAGKLGEVWEGLKAAGIGAFEGIAKAAGVIWDGLTGVIKGGVNAIIGIINLLIRGMNRINISIPDWVPNIGGRSFGVNIPQMNYMATGGLVTGPTVARMGEGGRNEAVLPLNESVYRQIGEGIAAARGGGAGMQLVVNYSGNGKWTREDAQGLGRLLVSELRSMGVRA